MENDVWVVRTAPDEPEVYVSRERACGRVEELIRGAVIGAKILNRGEKFLAHRDKVVSDVEDMLSDGAVEGASVVWNQFAVANGLGGVEFLGGRLIQ